MTKTIFCEIAHNRSKRDAILQARYNGVSETVIDLWLSTMRNI